MLVISNKFYEFLVQYSLLNSNVTGDFITKKQAPIYFKSLKFSDISSILLTVICSEGRHRTTLTSCHDILQRNRYVFVI